MNRGGSRKDAGRKRKLNFEERIHLGSVCENCLNQIWEKAREQRWEERLGVVELRELQYRFQSVPVAQRKSFCASAEGRELSQDIEFAIREIRGTPNFVDETNRVFTLDAPRPKGVKRDICEAVATDASVKWDLPDLGARYVQRCWDEYRAFLKEMAAEGV